MTNSADSACSEPHWYAVHTMYGQEVRVGELLQEEGLGESLVPRFIPRPSGKHTLEEPALLFHCYVFLRGYITQTVSSRIGKLEHVRSILGSTPGQPSPIPDHEIEVVRHLMSLGPQPPFEGSPPSGAWAEITSGPMAGTRGRILQSTNSKAVLAVSLSLVGKTFEVKVPVDILTPVAGDGDDSSGPPRRKKPRHRGGRRARRSVARRSAS